MIEVRPDPAHPQGGFARLEIAGATLGQDMAGVEVFDSFAGRYLGEAGWQATRFAFGPYPVERADGQECVRIGPEIVNQLTEYQPVRLQVGPLRADLSWPDDVVPAPDAAISGGIWTAPPTPTATKPTPAVKAPQSGQTAATDADTAETSVPAAPGPGKGEVAPPPRPSGRLPMALAGLAALAVIGAGAAYFLTEPPGSEPAPLAVAPPASAPEDACAMTALVALSNQGFAAVADRLRQCGNAVTPDDALGLLEAAARNNDPAALALFGRLYDPDSTDAPLESELGLTFSGDPARAAEYYDRAVQAGSQEAQPLLQAVCRRLLLMNDTLSQSAHEDHCGA